MDWETQLSGPDSLRDPYPAVNWYLGVPGQPDFFQGQEMVDPYEASLLVPLPPFLPLRLLANYQTKNGAAMCAILFQIKLYGAAYWMRSIYAQGEAV